MAHLNQMERERVMTLRMLAIVLLFNSVVLLQEPSADTVAPLVRVKQGPVVLHESICGLWGGHTFGYLLQGEKALYWSAHRYEQGKKTPVLVVGQHPLGDDSELAAAVTTIPVDPPGLDTASVPQMIRTPDGHLHIFVALNCRLPKRQFHLVHLRYFRSAKPDDISTLVDRTELIPITRPYKNFHSRMNVGIAPDGKRMALVVLSISEDGSVPFNTPIVFLGTRENDSGQLGDDFVFRKPIRYAEAMALFYPLVAATDGGIVVVGGIYDKYPALSTTRLFHLDWNGKVLHRKDLPARKAGRFLPYDMRPSARSDWSKLILYCGSEASANNVPPSHDFWEYNVDARKLRLLRSVQTTTYRANPGRWFPVADKSSVFLNNPSLSNLFVWEGNILGQGKLVYRALDGATPLRDGYASTVYVLVPNPLYGSVLSPHGVYVGTDCFNGGKSSDAPGPCSLLAWYLEFERDQEE